jgi:Arc/MetJ-type ribon-helix-helix transcriptional regulator
MGKRLKRSTRAREWVSTAIPRSLANEIQPLVEAGKYTGLTDFIADAVRRRLEELQQTHQELAAK